MRGVIVFAVGAALLFAVSSFAQSQHSAQTAASPGELLPEACRRLSETATQGAGGQSMPIMQGGGQSMPMMQGGGQGAPMMQDMSEAGRDYMQVMQDMNPAMMRGVAIKDPDIAFLCVMIPHHQGAIGIARAVLKHGKDAEVKKLAEKTIKEQEKDVKELTEAVRGHTR